MTAFNRFVRASGCAFIFCLSISPAFSIEGIHDDDHASLIKYYEDRANQAAMHLQEHQSQLEKYEAHPYYYGRQGQDFRSHTLANIHEYKKQLNDNLRHAELYRKILSQQQMPINKAKINIEDPASTVR
ncbi:hypothetical protein ABF87_02145 [Nitrosomonas sp. JL21]|uniref:hypothetical protein n=1 Tax=Nitrosomonas sp. JL21 TaxID=153949 RepID=UPI00136937D8|nr:hypothetical protein [Nitrosomonas sp. JL21]MBL8497830.1 hypothetical protein [Nitrosomonas sp.]MXS76776.1 hypothetical protein [Nitrosomonas sp. JL21]